MAGRFFGTDGHMRPPHQNTASPAAIMVGNTIGFRRLRGRGGQQHIGESTLRNRFKCLIDIGNLERIRKKRGHGQQSQVWRAPQPVPGTELRQLAVTCFRHVPVG